MIKRFLLTYMCGCTREVENREFTELATHYPELISGSGWDVCPDCEFTSSSNSGLEKWEEIPED